MASHKLCRVASIKSMRTEDASERLHLSLVNLHKNYDNPNPGQYTFDKRALGSGAWVVIINTGYNWEQLPEVSCEEARGVQSRRM